MDTIIFLVSVGILTVALWYTVVHKRRRLSTGWFVGAVVALVLAGLPGVTVWAVIATVLSKNSKIPFVDAYNDVLDSKRAQRLSEEGSRIGIDQHF